MVVQGGDPARDWAARGLGCTSGETAKDSRRRQGAHTSGSTVHHAGTLGSHGCGCASTGTHDVMGAARRVSV